MGVHRRPMESARKESLTSTHEGRVTPIRRQVIIWTYEAYCWLDHREQISTKFELQYKHFYSRKWIGKCRLRNGGHFVSASMCECGKYCHVVTSSWSVCNRVMTYSISQEICTRFCCALLCCGYAIIHNEFTLSIYPYSSGLLCWPWGNR